MPTHASTEKRLRQSRERRQQNRVQRSRIRTLIRNLRDDPAAENAPELLQEITVLLDRYAARGLHHPNKARRLKSNLTRLVNQARSGS